MFFYAIRDDDSVLINSINHSRSHLYAFKTYVLREIKKFSLIEIKSVILKTGHIFTSITAK